MKAGTYQQHLLQARQQCEGHPNIAPAENGHRSVLTVPLHACDSDLASQRHSDSRQNLLHLSYHHTRCAIRKAHLGRGLRAGHALKLCVAYTVAVSGRAFTGDFSTQSSKNEAQTPFTGLALCVLVSTRSTVHGYPACGGTPSCVISRLGFVCRVLCTRAPRCCFNGLFWEICA